MRAGYYNYVGFARGIKNPGASSWVLNKISEKRNPAELEFYR
jgi:hypothetical protein